MCGWCGDPAPLLAAELGMEIAATVDASWFESHPSIVVPLAGGRDPAIARSRPAPGGRPILGAQRSPAAAAPATPLDVGRLIRVSPAPAAETEAAACRPAVLLGDRERTGRRAAAKRVPSRLPAR